MRPRPQLRVLFLIASLPLGALGLHAQNSPDYEQPPISYSKANPDDAVTPLLARIARGEVTFGGSDREILEGVLRELHVPIASQVVVFSRTSLQANLIRPSRPRALYFADTVYVGWVQGGLIEVAAVDPVLGPVFYSIDPDDVRAKSRTFVREDSCLRCHGGTFIREVPGLFARTVFPSDKGEPLLRHGSGIVDDTTPFADRWGGWYVTGYTGTEPHRGNTLGSERDDKLEFSPNTKRPTDLKEFFDTARYLAPTSDVVALLVMEHQMAMQNALTHANQRARKMLDYQRSLQKSFGEPQTDEPSYDSVKSVFASAAENVVDHLLFYKAAPLPSGVEGSKDFRGAFATGVPRSASGATLKDLSLDRRLFALRCSYLIYSDTFRTLPAPLLDRIFARLHDALTSTDPKGRYAYLDAEEKHRILALLTETHPDARAQFAKRN